MHKAADALKLLGGSTSLPRKVLASVKMGPGEKLETLLSLRLARYKEDWWSLEYVLRYDFPKEILLCEQVVKDEDPLARQGAQEAQEALNWLKGDRDLLSFSNSPNDNLLRAYHGGKPEQNAETLLRPSEEERDDDRGKMK